MPAWISERVDTGRLSSLADALSAATMSTKMNGVAFILKKLNYED